MKWSLRTRLVVASVAVIVASVVVAEGVLRRSLVRELLGRIEADLAVRAGLVADTLGHDQATLEVSQTLVDALSARAGARLSIIAENGRLVADSLPSADRTHPHGDRPEVADAFVHGQGLALRMSRTSNAPVMYAAHRFETTAGAFVARLALSVGEVDEAVDRLRRLLLIGSLVALGVSVTLSIVGAHWASENARRLANAARRMAEGDLTAKAFEPGGGEFGELGGTLDKLATRLSSAFNELRAERDLLGGILAGMGEGVLVVGERDEVLLINHGLREMLLIGDDPTGRGVSELISEPILQETIQTARRTGTPASGELEIGGLKPRRLLVRALSRSPEPASTLVVFVDVTDLRRLEKLRRDFVANVSHELRTPVTAIRSATETLKGGAANDPDASAIFVDIIDRNAERLHALVEDLLDLSRLESREYKLRTEPVPLRQAILRTMELFDERARARGVTLAPPESSEALIVMADARALDQVLTNLLENALKYCASATRIALECTPESATLVRVSLVDTGPGIEPKHLPRLFERFYRIDKGRSRDVGGTGLGLSIVKHLVEAMGGTVGVESKLGVGSRFWFTVPSAGSDADVDAA